MSPRIRTAVVIASALAVAGVVAPATATTTASPAAAQPVLAAQSAVTLPPCSAVPVRLTASTSFSTAVKVRMWVDASPYRLRWVKKSEAVRVTVTAAKVAVTGQPAVGHSVSKVRAAFSKAVASAYSRGCGTPGCYTGTDKATDVTGAVFPYNGTSRTYNLHKPRSGPTPLVVAMHGATGTGKGMETVGGFRPLAAYFGVTMLYPEANSRIWNLTTDPAIVAAMLRKVEATHCINAAHVYVTGFSMGAMMTSILGCTTTEFAAAAPVAGIIPGNAARTCLPGTALLGWHGDADLAVGLDGSYSANVRILVPAWAVGVPRVTVAQTWAAANHCNTPTTAADLLGTVWTWRCPAGTSAAFHVEHGGDHHWPSGATVEMWRFFAQQQRENVAPRR